MPPIFADNMIIQRDQPVVLWGESLPMDKVTIQLQGQVKHTVANEMGKWRTTLNPIKTGGSYQLVVSAGTGKTIKINNIKAGDIWICAGQSNMNFMLAADRNGTNEIEHVNNDDIREYRTAMPAGVFNPENKDNSQWVSAIGKKAETFSAVAYYFAKQIQSTENIPIGIIVMSCGDTRAESWTDTVALKNQPTLKPLLWYWQKEKDNKNVNINHVPGKFYNDVVSPIIPFAVKGVVWYQGESNTLPDSSGRTIAERAAEYKTLLRTLIISWRNAWNKKNMPFYLIQLPNYTDPSGDIQWAKIRQAQLEAAHELSHVAMATTIDLGNTHNIHPDNKKPVGERVARLVLANEYNYKTATISGPVIENMKIDADKAVLYFKYIGKGLTSGSNHLLKGFEIADSVNPDNFIPAIAIVKGKKVIVWAAGVSNPAAVRYAWADDPQVSLYNIDGLPATPFYIKLNN